MTRFENIIKISHDIFNNIIRYRFIISLVTFILLVVGNIHGSSISQWSSITQNKSIHSIFPLGKSRGIRSDEWLVQTPLYLSQVKENLPMINPNIRSSGQNALISYFAPVWDYSLISKPFNWGFIVNGAIGLSWYWYSKFFLLLLSSFELFYILTKRSYLSALGAIWIVYSPAVQWWYSTAVTDLIIYAIALIVSVYYFIKKSSLLLSTVTALGIAVFTTGFILTLYPPIQVPLGYTIIIFIIYFVVKNNFFSSIDKSKLLLTSFIFLFILFQLIHFYQNTKDAIDILLNTSYPGQRISLGGEYNIAFLNYYLIDWLTPFQSINFLNECETSNFIHFLPLIILIFPFIYRKGGQHKNLMLILLFLTLFLIARTLIPLPLWLNKILLLSYVPDFRLSLIIGFNSLILSVWTMSILLNQRFFSMIESIYLLIILNIYYMYVIFTTFFSSYLGNINIIIILIFMTTLIYSLLNGFKKIATWLVLVFIISSGYFVNPIDRGIDVITNNEIINEINHLSQNDNPIWIVNNSILLGNLLVANGIRTFNSVDYYPDLILWKKFDKNQTFLNVYNRYAHVKVDITDLNKTEFKLIYPDDFCVKLSTNDLAKTKASFIVSEGPISNTIKNISFLKKTSNNNIYFYRINNTVKKD